MSNIIDRFSWNVNGIRAVADKGGILMAGKNYIAMDNIKMGLIVDVLHAMGILQEEFNLK